MHRTILTPAAVVLLGAALSACGGGGGGGGMTTTTPPPPTPSFETQFGTGFATAFDGSNNSEPQNVAAGDTIAVNASAEPVPLPNT